MSEPIVESQPQEIVNPEPAAPEETVAQDPQVTSTVDYQPGGTDAPVVPIISDNKTVVYLGENSYYDNAYGTLNRGDMRTVSPQTADELCSRQSDGKPLFAVI